MLHIPPSAEAGMQLPLPLLPLLTHSPEAAHSARYRPEPVTMTPHGSWGPANWASWHVSEPLEPPEPEGAWRHT